MTKTTTDAKKPARKTSDKIKEELGRPFKRPLMDDPDDPGPDGEIFKDEPENKHDPGPLPFLSAKVAEEDKKNLPDLHTPKIIITKGKILKGDKVEIEFTQQNSMDEEPAKGTYEHSAPPRKQLKSAMGALAIHACLLGEFIPLSSVGDISRPNPNLTKDFNVSGFTIHNTGTEKEGVTITAQKMLSNGKALGFNTPVTRFEDQSENAYSYLDELSDSIELCKDEMLEYLNGKHAEDPQGKLFD